MFSAKRSLSRAKFATLLGAAVVGSSALVYKRTAADEFKKHEPYNPPAYQPPPSRSQIISKLKSGEEYDILVVGGGATGAGVALDAATRGLRVGLVERDDFAAATSSRSTKLVHGGVRYLEKAVWNLDYGQYLLVKEALHERRTFLDMAPHLSFPLPIMIPLYQWWQLPYYWAGVKCYDLLAGSRNLESSYVLSRGRALAAFPVLNDDKLKGAVVYYDGSHNDSRTNLSLALTAVQAGADIVNHTEVTSLSKDASGKLNGADVIDKETGEKFHIKTKSIVNATGPFSDSLRKMDEGASTQNIVVPSSGVHIVLPSWYCPKNMGLLDPATADGRVVFFLPWQGATIAGTTDTSCAIEDNPTPSDKDIDFVLNEVKHYIDGKIDVRREDIRAAWSGIRPLVVDPKKAKKGSTQEVVRNHLVHVSDSGLVTVSGGKWTTFRQMAQETVDECIKNFGLPTPLSANALTESIKVVGGKDWTPLQYIDLIQRYDLDPEVAKYLSDNYGTCAFTVAQQGNSKERIVEGHPFVESEIHYAVKYEYAFSAVDFLARRTRLAFLDCLAAKEALPKVIDVMGQDLGWSAARKKQEYDDGIEFLKGMGLQSLQSGN